MRIKKERESRESYFVATFERGEAAYLSGQYDAAIADFTGFLERFPKVSGSYYYRGASLSNLGRHEEAIKGFDNAIALDSEQALYFLSRGNAYSGLKNIH